MSLHLPVGRKFARTQQETFLAATARSRHCPVSQSYPISLTYHTKDASLGSFSVTSVAKIGPVQTVVPSSLATLHSVVQEYESFLGQIQSPIPGKGGLHKKILRSERVLAKTM